MWHCHYPVKSTDLPRLIGSVTTPFMGSVARIEADVGSTRM
jgi:hypothetical protein